MSKKLKKCTMTKLKKCTMIISKQIKNIDNEIEIYKQKQKFWNWKVSPIWKNSLKGLKGDVSCRRNNQWIKDKLIEIMQSE